jgi:hypothetical protein
MFQRLFLGLILGLIVGGLAAAALVGGLHVALFGQDTSGAAIAYLAAALTGVLTGLVAGKPIWATNAKIEAGLKAFFGALLGAGLMFVLRRWVHVHPDLPMLAPGEPADIVHGAAVGDLPIVSLPLVAAILGGFFELDNTAAAEKEEAKTSAPASKKRVADGKSNGRGKARVADEEEEEGEESAPAGSKSAKR